MAESAVIDTLDRQIIRCLQLAARAPFRQLADVLGVSEQTVARRYRRMRRAGVLRVLGVVRPDALGASTWMVRVQCRPNGAAALATALAKRDDVAWVSLSAGGSEIVCVVRSLSVQAREELLLQRLPRTSPVLGISADVVLHVFVGATVPEDWAGLSGELTPAQTRRVRRLGVAKPPALTRSAQIDAADRALLDALATDGRAPYGVLAKAAGMSEARAARRLGALLHEGVTYIDVDVATSALGLHSQASLWLTVRPADLDTAGTALAAYGEVAFAAAISGRHNLTAAVYCRDLDALYAFVTTKVGALPGVQSMEILPVHRHVKQAGALVEDERFVD